MDSAAMLYNRYAQSSRINPFGKHSKKLCKAIRTEPLHSFQITEPAIAI